MLQVVVWANGNIVANYIVKYTTNIYINIKASAVVAAAIRYFMSVHTLLYILHTYIYIYIIHIWHIVLLVRTYCNIYIYINIPIYFVFICAIFCSVFWPRFCVKCAFRASYVHCTNCHSNTIETRDIQLHIRDEFVIRVLAHCKRTSWLSLTSHTLLLSSVDDTILRYACKM